MDCADSAEFAPNSTHHRIDAAIPKPEQPPNSRVVGSGIALGAPTQDAVCTSIAHICEAEGSRHAPPVTEMSRRTVTAPRLGRGSSRRPPPQGTTPLRYRTRTTVDLSTESGQLQLTGARWRLVGAEAVLKLRALRASGDFDAYWDFHEAREYERNHAQRYAERTAPSVSEPPPPPSPPRLRRVK